MNLPLQGDFIDIHNHGGEAAAGIFSVENLMAHEERIPALTPGLAYTFGIHPWHLTGESLDEQIALVRKYASCESIIALGEAGFDRLRGPSLEIQKRAFEEQVRIADSSGKPLYIHCVRAWDEILAEHKRLHPVSKWLVHGFRGKRELAEQLLSKGMYISFWFEFIIRAESSALVKSLPADRIFIETDGSGAEIGTIYNKVSLDLGISVDRLKAQMLRNYMELFNIDSIVKQ